MRLALKAMAMVAAGLWLAAAVWGQVPDGNQTTQPADGGSTDSALEAPSSGVVQAPETPGGTPGVAQPGVPEPGAPREVLPAPDVITPAPVASPQPALPVVPKKTVSLVKLNFSGEIDLRVFLDYVSKATGKNFLYDSKTLDGKVILLAPTEIPEENLFDLLESLLEYQNFALEPSTGGLIKVRKIGELLKRPIPLLLPEDLDVLLDSDKVVTTAYQLKYVSVTEIQTAVAPLVSQAAGAVAPIQRSNMLLITDTVTNLKRIARIIRTIDDEKNVPKLEIVQCKFAKAETLAGQIARVVRAQESSGGRPAEQQAANFDYDPASNSVIVVAPEAMLVKVRHLVAMLDVEPPASSSTWRLYPLKNSKAKDVANTLKQLAEGMPTGVRSIPGAQPPRGAGAEMPSAISVGDIRILGDENTNSIIVVGPLSAQKGIAELIAELDRRRPQVLIEALVVQVTGGNSLDIGTELASWGGRSGDAGIGTTSFGFSEYDYATGIRTINAGTGGLTGVLVNNAEIPILLRALLVESGGRIISRPRLLANDNAKAEFKSLDESPYTSVSTVTTTTTTAAFSGYQPAGTELYITPHISEGDYLNLEIELKLSQFTAPAIPGTDTMPGVPPPRRADSLKTEVAVPDQWGVIIGGLSGHHTTETVRQVPILGKIPLIGLLFSRKVKTQDDTVEYIFLKAQIARKQDFSDLKGMSDASRETVDKLRNAPAGVIPEEARESGGK